ncbi:MAG: hypothetical protein IBX58_14450 [Roseovarius sp.]|nr:hypothetical protein [Roseovarius sp.]
MQPTWTPEETAIRIAYELSPGLRRLGVSYRQAMENEPTAKALRLHAKAIAKKQEHRQ